MRGCHLQSTVAAGLLAAATWLLMGCAPQLLTYDQQLYMEADSLFKAGNYSAAKQRFARVRDASPTSKLAAKSQYNLGYIDVFYDNPASDWEAALKEFKAFAATYSNSDLLPEVNTWIRLLVVLRAFKREYNISAAELKEIQNRALGAGTPRQSSPAQNYDLLLESVSRCYADKDSLTKKIKVLEEVIAIFEKKR